MGKESDYDRNVFINCAFDSTFIQHFRAIVFTIHSCGFIARCALETGNAEGVRIDKIVRIIKDCRYGIHDLSCIELTEQSPLPRFNMPYELGIFMGCKSFGGAMHKKKDFIVIDSQPHRYKRLISDLAGFDFPAYDRNDVNSIIRLVRDWLYHSKPNSVLGSRFHQERYDKFLAVLPQLCDSIGTIPDELEFAEYYALVSAWIQQENFNFLEEEM